MDIVQNQEQSFGYLRSDGVKSPPKIKKEAYHEGDATSVIKAYRRKENL